MKHIFISLSIACAATLTAGAAAPLWMRDARISPDGSRIAYTYMGDIYTVPVTGGKATRLTSQPGRESAPIWSPDSRRIAFADNRNGNADIYIMDADGGTAKRLTSNSAAETPEAFTPDGSRVLFSAAIQDPASSALFPSRRLTELYSVPVDGGAVTLELATPAEMLSFIPGTSNFLYQDQKGVENAWRKHHTSSVTRDLWLYDAASRRHTNLTARPGEDRNPVVSADGSTVYFLSERDGGSFNVYTFPLSSPASVTAVTTFTTHPVRFLSQASDGTLAYTYDGEIYTQRPGSDPVKVAIDIVTDGNSQPEIVRVGNQNAEAMPSPDGTQIAVINRGDIFVTSVEYSTTRQVTNTPAAELDVAWHPQNRALVYASERDGHWNIYKASIARKDDPNFANATVINEEALFDAADGIERRYPQYSPDGDKLAYIEGREKLMVKDLTTGKETQLTDGSAWTDRSGAFEYRWSPDSRYIALDICDRKHDPYYDVAIVEVATGKLTNLTGTGYFDMSPRWVLDGNAVMFKSDRLGMRAHGSWGSQEDIFLVFMNQDAYDRFNLSEEDYELLKDVEKAQKAAKKADKDKKKDKKKGKKSKKETDGEDVELAEDAIIVETDGIQDRIVRLTPNSADLSGAIITADGETLYYLSAFEQGYDLWKMSLRDKDVSLVKKLDSRSMSMEPDANGKAIFLLGSRQLKKLDPKNDKLTSISISATHHIDPAAEREAMFNNVVFQEREMFYTPTMHGVDWDALTDHYRRFLPHINNGYDFAEMLSELLGELNVSHTGSGYVPSLTQVDPTGSLGLLYDLTYTGNGLKVEEIVKGGPFDRATTSLKPGCVIYKINGSPITPDADYTTLFSNIARKKTLVSFRNPADGTTHEEVVLPVTASAMNSLLYNRWVKARAAQVDSLSGGRLGYVHIQSMNDASFRKVYADVLGKYNDREGIVIDTRWNGGGRLHEDIEVLFSGHQYLTQEIRGKQTCAMPSRRWNKPSIMLICEANYSNAHGTPWVYKNRHMGTLVGMPVPGTMTSVNWMDLQNPDLYFGIPVIGYRTAEGTFLENSQLEPDIRVANDPADVVNGIDTQLETAVRELLRQIDIK